MSHGVTGRGGIWLLRPVALAIMLLPAIGPAASQAPQSAVEHPVNPVHWFEIPVTDMARAIAFYRAVLGATFERQTIDGYEMALFARTEGAAGASGALAKGDVYVPSLNGPILYFDVPDIDPVLDRARAAGATILLPKKAIGPNGHVAEIRDSEGNRIGLHSLRD